MADPDKAQGAKPENRKKEAVLVVTASQAGRRRAGFSFGREPVEISLADLKKPQIEAIKADPLLSVKTVE